MADEASSLFLCPHCGAFVSDSSSKCPNCGNMLEDMDEEELELELDELLIDEQQDAPESEPDIQPEEANPDSLSKSSEESGDSSEPSSETEEGAVTLFLCSVCGAFTGGNADNCSQCGASMTDVEEDPIPRPDIQPDDAEVLDMLVEAVPDDEGPSEADTEDQSQDTSEEDEFLLNDLKNIESAEDVMSFIDSIPDGEEEAPESEPDLEIDLKPPNEIMPERSEESDDILSQLAYASDDSDSDESNYDEPDDDSRSTAIHAVEDIVDDLPSGSEEDSDSIAMCNSCGAFVSESADVCNVCGQSLKDDKKFVPEAETPLTEDTQDNQAESIIRSLLGVDEDIVLDEEVDRFQADGNLGLCTVCGAFISEYAESCTVCGTHLNEMPEFVPSVDLKDKLTDNKALALCPHCGVFVQEGSTECMSCVKPITEGAKVEMVDIEERQFDADKASSLLRNFLGVEKSLEMVPTRDPSMSGLDICPDCGAFVSLRAVSCSVCGNSLFDGEIEKPELVAEQKMSCPNCDSKIASGSPECPLCGMVFAADDDFDLELEGPGEDITDFLEKDLEESIRHLEMEAGVELLSDDQQQEELLPEVPEREEIISDDSEAEVILEKEIPEKVSIEEELLEEIILEDEFSEDEATESIELELEESSEAEEEKPPEDDLWIDDDLEVLEVEEYISDILVEYESEEEPSEEDIDAEDSVEVEEEYPDEDIDVEGSVEVEGEYPEDTVTLDSEGPVDSQESVDSPEPDDYKEPLEFIDDLGSPVSPEEEEFFEVQEEPEEEYIEEDVVEEIPVDRDLSRFDTEAKPRAKPANWATGIYVSVAAICFFLAFYTLVPGDYAPGLAVIFGTFLLIGIYLSFTERGTFFKGDLKRGAGFIAGTVFAAGILLHWPMGILISDQGAFGQPALDRLMLSVSILLISIGILWIRARVRYVLTWFGGITLLFLGTVMQFTYTGWGDAAASPVMLVAGLGASLVFLSLIFLQYERALNTSIESDIVRGDAHYLRRDYKGALTSYDDALSKSQIKRVEIIGSPLIEYDVPWYSKGSALILMGEFDEGIKCLDMALAINPNNEVTWVNKGNAHSKLGEHSVAMECYQRAIEVNPFYEIAWNNMGNVMARQKKYVEALKHYNRSIKINPKYDDAWINKGYVLAKMGKKEQAIKCLSHVGSRAKIDVPGSETDVSPTSKA